MHVCRTEAVDYTAITTLSKTWWLGVGCSIDPGGGVHDTDFVGAIYWAEMLSTGDW